MNKPRVGILTTFTGVDSAYSLVNVVRTQLQMLLQAGYHPVLFVSQDFTVDGGFWSGRVFEIRKAAHIDDKAKSVYSSLKPTISDIDVFLCHDILFLGQHKEWGVAIRKLARDFPHKAWLHWQHSRGGHSPIESMENSRFCYPNMDDLEHVAEINSTSKDRVHYVPHPLDIDYLKWPELAMRIADDYSFIDADIRMVYPSRLDSQKQVDKIVRLFAGFKRAGKSVCLLIADAYATGERFIAYKRSLRAIADEQGLTEDEFVFLGHQYSECKVATPRPVVKALHEMSNIFVQSSNAETSSLVAMEAALAGSMLVINSDFQPIHHLYQGALTLPFGSIFEDTKYYRHVDTAGGFEKVEDAQAFWDDEAKNTIIPALNSQLTIKVKDQQLRDRWPGKVFSEHIEPLILDAWSETKSDDVQVVSNPGDEEVTAIITTLDNLPILQRQVPIMLSECGKVIVVNNGSRDGTRAWLESINDERVLPIHRKNFGAGPGRNDGLKLWDTDPTPYTLMLDGGILPPQRGVAQLKNYLERHEEVSVISPEVVTSFVNDETDATRILPKILDEWCFAQSMLSSTAYALCRASAWKVRFSEDGPFGEAGWGADDNDMQYRWNDARVLHHDIAGLRSNIRLLRRGSGSFDRLYEETGVWPSQYGSVFEKRCVYLFQNWRHYYDDIYHAWSHIQYSFIIKELQHPELAYAVKEIHDHFLDSKEPDEKKRNRVSHEIIYTGVPAPMTEWWLETYRLRWPWSDTTIDAGTGDILRRGEENEATWTGDVQINTEPRGKKVVEVTKENLERLLNQ
jgi:glycosyltransferase involved in cell wall biosynthesis